MKKSQDPEFKAIIIDHYKQPRFFGKPDAVRFAAEEHNRTCGDHVEVFLTDGASPDRRSFQFTGAGCSLSIASSSLMSSLLQNVSIEDARLCLDQFQRVSKEGVEPSAEAVWQIFDGLRDYPVRSRCVRLPWQALEKILTLWSEDKS
ncbi:MAG TPA: iron-sulfur cluster assembly scaffold protein [Oligoflexus sp.]|uniref:iron-sulfur cluster assembly scaffold protein n=1 Tax=Oligoflexus sp. TaxID=1971216 RepID=UPI002D4DF77A|nr:iron-sulfur cluster assembly scaffold protein [Oligoflexus sp.]HYX37795.1 iron-sulfur cluster assembly scaffold protein [Oligoflexus sp.]